MKDYVLLGRGRQIVEIPAAHWKQELAHVSEHSQELLRFMTEAHHKVRYFVVGELARTGEPIEPARIAERLELPLGQVAGILDALEKKLFFLARNELGAVSWAYPVTVEPTPHRLNFSTGERFYGAWAEDALAAPFVQGRIRNEQLTAEVETKCQACGRSLHLTVDSSMHISVAEAGAEPWVFMPDMDWEHFTERTIIDAY